MKTSNQQWMSELGPESSSLNPLPAVLHRGFSAIVVFAIMSFVSTSTLLVILIHRLFFKWRKRPHTVQYQFVFLIFNLILADIQQAIAYTMNLNWIIHDQIDVGSADCYVQGWFVTMGNLCSGVWALAIAVHTFCCIALQYSPSERLFYRLITGLWIFCVLPIVIGIAQHPVDIFVRADTWCWINSKYTALRLWGHYFWIFLSEFGNVLLYASLFVIVRTRIKKAYFSAAAAARAQKAARVMLIYPLIYVVCTLPLASARMAALTGVKPSLKHMSIAGAMITSTGWLDVLVYTFTRHVLQDTGDVQPGDAPHVDAEMIGTFALWEDRNQYGTTTIIEAGPHHASGRSNRSTHNSNAGTMDANSLSRQDSTELLFRDVGIGSLAVKTETTVVVHSEPLELHDIAGHTHAKNRVLVREKDRVSFDTEGSTSKGS